MQSRHVKSNLVMATALFFWFSSSAQHPAREKIDSLKKILPSLRGIQRIDCLDALSEEYWWPPRVWPDSITMWAADAYEGSVRASYTKGVAASSLHLGVADIYRKNFLTAEKNIRAALRIYDSLRDTNGLGWSNLFLGQTLYSENKFNDASFYILRSLPLLQAVDNREGQGKAWAWMGFLLAATGNYDSSLEYCKKSLQIRQMMSDDVCVAASLANMGYLYKSAGDYEDALDYYRQGMQYARSRGINYYAANWNYFDEPIGAIYQLMNNPDSSLYYLQKAMLIDPGNQMTRISFGETLLLKKKYDSALAIFTRPLDHLRRENDLWDLMRILPDAAKAYLGKKDNAAALKYAAEGFSLAKQASIKPYMFQGYLLLSRINEALGNKDSAYTLMQQYILLRDSVSTHQFIWRITNYKKGTAFQEKQKELVILDRENKLKETRLKEASIARWLMLAGLLVILLAAWFIIRSFSLARKNEQLESQKIQSELQLKANGLELQALRAQMNPHFIFNCLSSINRFILKNEKIAASDYLTKFSKLIRMVLSGSSKNLIPLQDELDMLHLYLEMEKLRFSQSFDFSITVSINEDLNLVFIPPLLLQPFVENAIWHGLMHKEEKGKLDICLTKQDNMLQCIITDNGVGRNKAAAFNKHSVERQKSMGLKITAERLALMNQTGSVESGYIIEDIINEKGNAAGTRVILRLLFHTSEYQSEKTNLKIINADSYHR
jgi:tetratricopeptide (TPR) repeat protein